MAVSEGLMALLFGCCDYIGLLTRPVAPAVPNALCICKYLWADPPRSVLKTSK